jgi:hypothetical protein
LATGFGADFETTTDGSFDAGVDTRGFALEVAEVAVAGTALPAEEGAVFAGFFVGVALVGFLSGGGCLMAREAEGVGVDCFGDGLREGAGLGAQEVPLTVGEVAGFLAGEGEGAAGLIRGVEDGDGAAGE